MANFNKFFLLISFLLFLVDTEAQNIGINNPTPDASAILDITSTDKGLLVPRVALDDATTAAPVTSPVEGLLIYNETGTEPHGFYYWDGTAWIMLCSVNNSGGGVLDDGSSILRNKK